MSSVFRSVAARCLPVCCLIVFGAACTPQQALISALVPDGTASMLLSHLQDVEDVNRRRIVELEQQRDWAGLAQFADANIARDPFSAEWRLIGGYARSQAREYRLAAGYFGEMVRLAPDDITAYHFLAEAQRAAGEPRRALNTLERALLVSRDAPLTHFLLGEAYGDLLRHDAAAAAYRRALALDPMFAGAWFGLGRASLKEGRVQEARDALRALEQMKSPRAAELAALMPR